MRNAADHLIGTIRGPVGTPYEGGFFEVDIEVPLQYPFAPPKMKFITKVYHPNVSSQTGGPRGACPCSTVGEVADSRSQDNCPVVVGFPASHLPGHSQERVEPRAVAQNGAPVAAGITVHAGARRPPGRRRRRPVQEQPR